MRGLCSPDRSPLRLAALTIALLLARTAPAANDANEAKRHFEQAKTAYALGNFSVAANEFEEAYKLKPLAELLYNAAQAHRLAGNHSKALVMYRNYLNLYPKERNLPEVRKQIASLEAVVSAEEHAKSQAPTATVEADLPTVRETPAEPPRAAAPQPEPTPQPPREPPPPVYKRWWLWTVVGVVVVAAIAIPVALVATASPWQDATVGPGAHTVALGVRF